MAYFRSFIQSFVCVQFAAQRLAVVLFDAIATGSLLDTYGGSRTKSWLSNWVQERGSHWVFVDQDASCCCMAAILRFSLATARKARILAISL